MMMTAWYICFLSKLNGDTTKSVCDSGILLVKDMWIRDSYICKNLLRVDESSYTNTENNELMDTVFSEKNTSAQWLDEPRPIIEIKSVPNILLNFLERNYSSYSWYRTQRQSNFGNFGHDDEIKIWLHFSKKKTHDHSQNIFISSVEYLRCCYIG